MKNQIEKTLGKQYDNINKSIHTPYIATRWNDGTKTKGKRANARDRELNNLDITLKGQGREEIKELDSSDNKQ